MIKKLFILFLFLFMSVIMPPLFSAEFVSASFAAESLKVNSINFDNSDSIIFLGTLSSQEQSEANITKKILQDRVYIDIENAVTTFPSKTYEFKNSRMSKIKISQNSLNPDVVRIVLWHSPNYNPSDIKILNIKNNIIIKLGNDIPTQKYLTQVYRETTDSSSDYYDKTVIMQEQPQVQKTESDEIFNRVQQAFKDNSQELVRPNIEQKQARLKSRFFLEKIGVQNGNIVISGIGVINVSKPFNLTEPSRTVFDLPNTIVKQELRDREFRISDTASVKIGQFTPSTARIVIKSENSSSYLPLYSKNLNTVTLASGVKSYVTSAKTELTYFKDSPVNSVTDVVNISFSAPVVYSLKREADSINLTFYNLINFDVNSFNAKALENKAGYKAKQLSPEIITLSLPLKSDTLVDCYETLDASKLRLVFTKRISQQSVAKPVQQPKTGVADTGKKGETLKKVSTEQLYENQKQKRGRKKHGKEDPKLIKLKSKIIVIDPGHGGNDTGAQRRNVLEKDLNLQIALKVKNLLYEKGFHNVVMTRYSDKTLTLQDRCDISNNNNADIYVSIHINASVKTEINGIETHYYTDKGYEVAEYLHKELIQKIDAQDRGLFKSKFYVINHTEAPSVLLELGFISNDKEREELMSEERQNASAEAVVKGIINYLTEHLDE